MATTIKDIARNLGVAPSTVTRALGGSPRIGDEMKQRVSALARTMNYVPSAAAQAMRSQSSNIVGFIVPDVENNDVAAIAKEIAGCCSRIGFQLVLALHGDDPQSEYEHLRALVSARAAALVFVPTDGPLEASLALLQRLPVIQVIRQIDGVASSNFACDDAAGTRDAVKHLLALGHRRIAYLGNALTLSTGRERLRGFRAALRAARVPLPDELVCTTDHTGTDAVPLLHGLLRHRPTALVLGGSRTTAPVVTELSDMGVAVPAELSVIGFGERSWSRWWGPGLTTIEMPARELAALAGQYLVNLIGPEKSADAIAPLRTETMRPRLNLRGSTAPPGA